MGFYFYLAVSEPKMIWKKKIKLFLSQDNRNVVKMIVSEAAKKTFHPQTASQLTVTFSDILGLLIRHMFNVNPLLLFKNSKEIYSCCCSNFKTTL